MLNRCLWCADQIVVEYDHHKLLIPLELMSLFSKITSLGEGAC